MSKPSKNIIRDTVARAHTISKDTDTLRITSQTKSELVLRKSKVSLLSKLISTLLVTPFVMTVVLLITWHNWPITQLDGLVEQIKEQPEKMIAIVFGIVSVLVAFQTIQETRRLLLLLIHGEGVRFNRFNQSIEHNGKVAAKFSDIESVKIRTFSGDDSKEYRLSMALREGGNLLIEEGCERERIRALAEAVADTLGVKIELIE
ncbi:hypothetical protein [Aliagarivorans taiwanensis]|uniref:hypothetical protein n=1 Tax=Aliagarivorans taiwanensis TaxID=561966 RepID=UPI0012FC17D9|nr:hypothetical protein [Aliagarivorans taiwanensis]